MKTAEKLALKDKFKRQLKALARTLPGCIAGDDAQWTIKGFIDIYKNIYTLTADTKVVSKVLEIHLFPRILEFAERHSYRLVLPEYQNHYPDFSFVAKRDDSIKFAVDIKTTYRLPNNPELCNRFTLGSHGSYFINRTGKKNIRFPYGDYLGHFCLGIIYTRTDAATKDKPKVHPIRRLRSITSVIKDFQFFVAEKWEIASDKQGSGNTANIGSISRIRDLLKGNGIFKKLGEKWFDDYWMNYGRITITTPDRKQKTITRLAEFLRYKGKDESLVNPCASPSRKKGPRNSKR